MKKMKLILFALAISFSSAFGQVIHIPDDFGSIQEGINASNNGDTIIVDTGTYYENINFRGKAITLTSKYLLERDSTYIYNTIINGSQPQPGDSGSVVVFTSAEDTSSVLCGFTLTGGTGSISPPHPYVVKLKGGGGIYMYGGGGKIIHNIITDNHVVNEYEAFGGGIHGVILPDDNMIIFEENLVFNNTANGKVWAKGGGVCIAWCHTRIRNNIIRDNSVSCDSIIENVTAGGLWYSHDASYIACAIIEGNIITNNEVHALNPCSHGTLGAGMIIWGTFGQLYAKVSQNIIAGNKIFASDLTFGSGAMINFCDSIDFCENEIYNNSHQSYQSFGGGLCIANSYGHVYVNSNLFYENSASKGGGVSIFNSAFSCEVNMEKNTIFGNYAELKGGGIHLQNSNTHLINSIVWENNAPIDDAIHEEMNNYLLVDYSDIEGGWSGAGIGNINADPQFESTGIYDFHLLYNSPCIDSGHPNINDPDGSRVDMGTFYFDHRPVLIDLESNSTSTSFLLSWTACEGALGYLADLAYDQFFNDYVGDYHNYDVGNTTAFEFTGLTPGTTYYVRLRANYFMGRSDYSDTAVIFNLGMEEEILPKININVFPNPFISSVNVKFSLSEKSVINTNIYNVVGERVFTIPGREHNIGEHTIQVNLSGLPAGVYFLQIIGGDNTATKKIIKRN